MRCSESGTAGGVEVEGGSCYIKSVGYSICKCVNSRSDIAVIDMILAPETSDTPGGNWRGKGLKLSHVSKSFCVGPSSKGAHFTPPVIDARIKECEEG